jgi:hypothetical protein
MNKRIIISAVINLLLHIKMLEIFFSNRIFFIRFTYELYQITNFMLIDHIQPSISESSQKLSPTKNILPKFKQKTLPISNKVEQLISLPFLRLFPKIK